MEFTVSGHHSSLRIWLPRVVHCLSTLTQIRMMTFVLDSLAWEVLQLPRQVLQLPRQMGETMLVGVPGVPTTGYQL